MFGLKKCEEEDFYQFTYSNLRFHPENISGFLYGILFVTLIVSGIEYIYIINTNVPQFTVKIIEVIIGINILLYILSRVNKKKYAYMFQKNMVIALTIYWYILSLSIYPLPLTIAFYKNNAVVFNAIIYGIILGFIYSLCIFIRLIILIKKKETGKGEFFLYNKIFKRKIIYLGFSVPIIVVASKLARNVTIAMNNSGFDIGPLILMSILAFIMQIIMFTFIPEFTVLIYCKSRFKSFIIPYEQYLSRGKKRKK